MSGSKNGVLDGIQVSMRGIITACLFGLYFLSLGLFVNTLNNGIIILSVFSCFLISYLNIRKVEYLISSYIGMFVITLTAQTNYLLVYSVINIIVLCIIFRKRIISSISRPVVTLFLFVGCIGISIVNSVETDFAKEAFVGFGVSIVIFYSITLISQHSINLADIYWYSTIYITGMILVFFSNHTIQELANTHRALIYFIGDSGTRSNTLAGYIAVFMFLCWGCWKHNKQIIRRTVSIICFFPMCIILYFTISRGAYLGMAVSFIPLILFNLTKKRLLMINFTVVVILLGIYLFSEEIFNSRLFGSSTGDYSNGRWDYYSLAWEQFKMHPIIGNGMYQFGFLGGMGKLEDPHNWLLAYLSGIGLLGTICFLLFLLSIVSKILKVLVNKNIDKRSIVLAQASTVPIIHGLVEPAMSTGLPFMLFCIVSPILYSYMIRQEKLNN
jgi:O-antigen ligase